MGWKPCASEATSFWSCPSAPAFEVRRVRYWAAGLTSISRVASHAAALHDPPHIAGSRLESLINFVTRWLSYRGHLDVAFGVHVLRNLLLHPASSTAKCLVAPRMMPVGEILRHHLFSNLLSHCLAWALALSDTQYSLERAHKVYSRNVGDCSLNLTRWLLPSITLHTKLLASLCGRGESSSVFPLRADDGLHRGDMALALKTSHGWKKAAHVVD
ncbi:hypothetical protein Efla_007666 [Eimeria flavescens]